MEKINFEELENKYIDLLLNRCVNFKNTTSLFIVYDKAIKNFADKIIIRAKEMGVTDIGIDEEDIFEYKKMVEETKLEDIETHPYFNKKMWDEYALKNSAFIIIDTEFPGVMDEVDPEKLAKARFANRKTRSIFREKERSYEIPWCISAYPNKLWAQDVFKNDPNAYEKLFLNIMKFCMVDQEDPIKSWDKLLKNLEYYQNKLNDLEITKLYYSNSLGTNFSIDLLKNCIWNSAASECKNGLLVNLPTFEIFTSPDYRTANGIVYSSRPLIENGAKIDDFSIEFKDGKAIDCHAKVGEDILRNMINTDEYSCYLGEVALVSKNTPVCQSGIVTGTTLLDENSACHLALGEGFITAMKNGINMSEEECIKKGLNLKTPTHVDFMIGTDDLNIEADTKYGRKLIFKNGDYNL